jgi:hypothetical protein
MSVRRFHRRLTQLACADDPVFASDRRFFERHPHRSHYARLASLAEIEGLALMSESPFPLKHGQLVTIVKQVVPGVRLRAFVGTTNSDDVDSLDEHAAEVLFDLGALAARLVVGRDGPSTSVGDLEAALRAAFGGRNRGEP